MVTKHIYIHTMAAYIYISRATVRVGVFEISTSYIGFVRIMI